MLRSIPETAAVIIGSLGREQRVIACKSGHSVGKIVTIEATIVLGGSNSNPRWMEVVLGERNKGMDGINVPLIPHKERNFRFGNKRSFMVQSWVAERTSGEGVS